MNFIDFIKGNRDNDVSTVFADDKHAVTAMDAYQKSRFGIVKTEKQMLQEFFTDVRTLINAKNFERSYCGMVEIDKDIVCFLPKIKERLVKELGFRIIVLNDNSIITNVIDGKEEKSSLNTGSTFLLIFWDKKSIEWVANINAADKEQQTTPVNSTVDSSVPVISGENAKKNGLKSLND